MTKERLKYKPYLIALLLSVLQMAGTDVYAQVVLETAPRDSLIQRESPKARARRHRDTAPAKPGDSIRTNTSTPAKDSAVVRKPDSIPLKHASTIADSLEKVNQSNLQKIDASIVLPQPRDTIPPALPQKQWIPDSSKATWLAVIFPGGGQIYNRKYWKLPIIYGGFAGCAYALSWNGKMYKDYSQAYLDIMDNNPNTNSYLDLLPVNSNYPIDQLKETIRKRKDMFRRYRDLSIFAFIGVYIISIIDAYVDAELSNFDISPDLSMRIEPTIMNDRFRSGGKSVGVQCSLRF